MCGGGARNLFLNGYSLSVCGGKFLEINNCGICTTL